MNHLKTFEGKIKWYNKGKFTRYDSDFDDIEDAKFITLKSCINFHSNHKKIIKFPPERWEELVLILNEMKAIWASGDEPKKFMPYLINGFYYIMLKKIHMGDFKVGIYTINNDKSITNYEVIDIEDIDLGVYEARVKWYSNGKTEEDDKDYPDFLEYDIIFSQKFTYFLINKGAYEKFIKNYMIQKRIKTIEDVNRSLFAKFGNNDIVNIITNSFSYSSTPEGRDYWLPLNDDWNYYVRYGKLR